MNYPHVRAGSSLSKSELKTLIDLNKAMRMQPAGPFQPVGPIPQSPKPQRREVTTPARQPVPTMKQRAALKTVIARGGWQGKIAKFHLDALWRRLPDLGLEHDTASNSIRPQQAAPLQGGRPRTKRASDAATRGLVIAQHMKEGHLATFTQANGERAQGSIAGWGKHGATIRTTDGQALAVPYTVMTRVEPPPEMSRPGVTSPASTRKSRSRPTFDEMVKAEEARQPERTR